MVAVSQQRFGQGAVSGDRVAVDPKHVQLIAGAPRIEPTPQSLEPTSARGIRPPQQAMSRPVVATRPPHVWTEPPMKDEPKLLAPAQTGPAPRLVAPPASGSSSASPRAPFGQSPIERKSIGQPQPPSPPAFGGSRQGAIDTPPTGQRPVQAAPRPGHSTGVAAPPQEPRGPVNTPRDVPSMSQPRPTPQGPAVTQPRPVPQSPSGAQPGTMPPQPRPVQPPSVTQPGTMPQPPAASQPGRCPRTVGGRSARRHGAAAERRRAARDRPARAARSVGGAPSSCRGRAASVATGAGASSGRLRGRRRRRRLSRRRVRFPASRPIAWRRILR